MNWAIDLNQMPFLLVRKPHALHPKVRRTSNNSTGSDMAHTPVCRPENTSFPQPPMQGHFAGDGRHSSRLYARPGLTRSNAHPASFSAALRLTIDGSERCSKVHSFARIAPFSIARRREQLQGRRCRRRLRLPRSYEVHAREGTRGVSIGVENCTPDHTNREHRTLPNAVAALPILAI